MNSFRIAFVFFCVSILGYSQITVDNTTFTVDQLIDGVLFESGCTAISNIQFSTGSTPAQNGIAYFDRNGSTFSLNDGIILSTGNALSAAGPNDEAGRSDALNTASDPDLEAVMAAAGSPLTSRDVTWISFDFTPIASFISFDYLFASEEYNGNFECQFADAFAFILTDSVTGDVTNLATLPGSTTPVQVITVRDPPATACAPVNPGFFDTYNLGGNTFAGNIPSLGLPAANSPIEFNGQTSVLRAESAVVPNRTYNIKLVIGDATDTQFDSAVFIAGGSFDIGVDLGENRTIANGNPLCAGDSFTIDATISTGATVSYEWFLSGNLIPGETGPTLDATESGFYTVNLTFPSGCTSTANLFLQFIELPEATVPDAISCNPSGIGTYDLVNIESILLSGLNALNYQVTFHESLLDAQNATNIVPTTTSYIGLTNPQTLYVRVEDVNFGCVLIESFTLILDDVAAAAAQDIIVCDDDNDAVTTFNLSDFDDLVAPGYTPGTVTISYHNSQLEADNNQNPLPNSFTNISSPQTIFVRVASTNDTGCFDTTTVNIIVNTQPLAAQVPGDLSLCDDVSGNGIEVFDLTRVEVDIIGSQDFSDVDITYHNSLADAENNVNSIVTPDSFQNTTSPQQIFVRLENRVTGCFNIDVSFNIIVNDIPDILDPDPYELCDDNMVDSFTDFDLATRDNEITNGNPDYQVFYYRNQNDADNRINEINGLFTNTSNPQTLIIVVEDINTGCIATTDIDLIVVASPPLNTPQDLSLCDDNNTGDLTELFDLTSNESLILNGLAGVVVTYYNTQNDANTDTNAISNPNSYENQSVTEDIYVRVENALGCFNTTVFQIQVNEVAVPNLFDLYYICIDENGSLLTTADSPPVLDTAISNPDIIYQWELDGVIIAGQNNSSLTADQPGIYTVTASNSITGCSASQSTEVRQLGPPDRFGAEVVTRYFDDVHIIEAFAEGPANQYIFRLDDGPWQFNGTFEDVSPGSYTVFIQDSDGCGSVEIPLEVIGYPRFFTPNADGFNDYWNIIGINDEPSTIIYIFDRYGKLLKELNPSGIGWDGTFNGEPMPSSDYWFKVEYLENGIPRTFGGHFSLKR